MTKTTTVRARIEPELKRNAEGVLSLLGLSPTDAITLFYRQVILQNGLPFEIKVPSAETLEAIRQAREKENPVRYENLDDLMLDLDKP